MVILDFRITAAGGRLLPEHILLFQQAEGALLALEHPQQGLTRWLDVHDVCRLLHTTDKTLRRWTHQGLLHPSRTGRRLYYDSAEVDALLRSNIIQPNGRADLTGS